MVTTEYGTEENSGIYRIRNVVNGKIYVGSSTNLRKRMYAHFGTLKKGTHPSRHLQAAYNLYGGDSFVFEHLAYCDESKLIEFEQWFLDKLKPEYNVRKTADRNLGVSMKGKVFSEETKRKLSESHKGKPQSKETVAKRVANRKKTYDALTLEQKRERYKSHKGKTVSEETRARLSSSAKAAWNRIRGIDG